MYTSEKIQIYRDTERRRMEELRGKLQQHPSIHRLRKKWFSQKSKTTQKTTESGRTDEHETNLGLRKNHTN